LSAHQWLVHPDVIGNAVLRELLPAVLEPTGTSSAGYPYLARAAWTRLRDWVPHTLGSGLVVWSALDWIDQRVGEVAHNATRVIRQVVRTASVTAPPDLWLLRHVLSALEHSGTAERLAAGLDRVPPELEPDLALLLSRGFLVKRGAGFRWSDEPSATQIRALPPLPLDRPTDLARRLHALLQGQPVAAGDERLLLSVLGEPLPTSHRYAPRWVATAEDLELGYRLVPLVLGLEAARRNRAIVGAGRVLPEHLAPLSPALCEAALATLHSAGWIDQEARVTPIGSRAFQRAPGPFGIIEAYHPYMSVLPRIWSEGRGSVHVERSANVAASQTANRQTFAQANAALDRFCADTGFTYRVFIEHAVGKGEAIRQRVALSGEGLSYVGADLEAAALAAARQEVEAGRLPQGTLFVQADIGRPEQLVERLRESGIDPYGAVMIVGNGFHEFRDQSDERMVEVFRGYETAGIVVIFTEESALSVDDLLETAWNTYHAGFKYVHERSGQGLRPAVPSPTPGLGPPLPASWVECATRAGYVRLERYSFRSRTVYPYPPVGGHNPSISATGLFVPAKIAAGLTFST
jgi:hypothetical protein